IPNPAPSAGTIRQIADQLHHAPKTILRALANPEPVSAAPSEPRPAPVFGPVRAVVDALLAAGQAAPRKQRHTASPAYRRLVAEHGYTGGYDQVRRSLKQRRLDRRATFIPLEHPPGRAAPALLVEALFFQARVFGFHQGGSLCRRCMLKATQSRGTASGSVQ